LDRGSVSDYDVLIIGLDPGLGITGWGVIARSGNRLSHIANGQVRTDPKAPLAERLVTLDRELTDVILTHRPDSSAVEEVFVNANPQSTLKLGHARGVCLLALARAGLPVSEYATRLVKKAIVGTGAAEKAQVQAMLKVLLPGVKLAGADAADALAVAIAHAHMAR
jgi:crossover junction endodeoxyribonuclease RuvC